MAKIKSRIQLMKRYYLLCILLFVFVVSVLTLWTVHSPLLLSSGNSSGDDTAKYNDNLIKVLTISSSTGTTTSSVSDNNKAMDENRCGCPHTCTDQVFFRRWKNLNKCSDRVQYLQDRYLVSQLDSCRNSVKEGICTYQCHPDFCTPLPNATSSPNIQWERYDGVVIVTKVLWPKDLPQLKLMICLVNAAYNRFVHYDFVVFTTMPWTEEQIRELQQVALPAKLVVSLEGPSLEERLQSMTLEEQIFLKRRCGVADNGTLTYFNYCTEENFAHVNNLGYCWQSEFRAYHIWKHPILKPYHYMIWFDTDALCTKTWEQDPIRLFIENNLVALYDFFPAGTSNQASLKKKMKDVYNYTICRISQTTEGTFATRLCDEDRIEKEQVHLPQINGFFHITNLDVYRKEKHLQFLHSMVGDYPYSRQYDDQLAVTLIAALEDPKRTWDLRKHNITLGIHHHFRLDGNVMIGAFPSYWKKQAINTSWVEGYETCAWLGP